MKIANIKSTTRRESAVINKMDNTLNVLSNEKVQRIINEKIDGSFGDITAIKKDKERVLKEKNN